MGEIGQIADRLTVAARVEANALVNLLGDALRGLAVGGAEGLVVTERAAAPAQ